MKRSVFVAVVGVSILLAVPAFAAHPLITDDPNTQGKGKFQLEVNGQTGMDDETDAGGNRTKVRDTALATVLSYGASKEVDLIVGALYRDYIAKENGERVAAENGYSDVVVEVKWRFLEKDGFALALKPGVILPSGNEQKGLGAGKAGYGAFLIGSKELEPLTVLVNIGYVRNENKLAEQVDLWHLSAAAIYKATENLQLVANIGQATNTDKNVDRYPAFALAGAIYGISESFDVDFGVKFGLNNAETDVIYLAGIALRF
jgi:hypothetical protein